MTGSSPDSLSLSWTVPQGDFDSFTVQYKDSDGRPQVVRVGGQEREATVRDLEPGRKYKMNLYGLHDGQRVGPVSTVGVTGESWPPPLPHASQLFLQLTHPERSFPHSSLFPPLPDLTGSLIPSSPGISDS